MSWGDGTGVPTSEKDLVIVGTDNDNQLHIRAFDQDGNRVIDTVETKLPPAQAQVISTLKQQLPGLLPPQVLTDAKKAQVLTDATSIVGRTYRPGALTPEEKFFYDSASKFWAGVLAPAPRRLYEG